MPAARMNKGKPLFSFILDFPKALLAFCRVMEIGAIKYERNNWKEGGKPDEEYFDAAMRHMVDLKNGEQFAKDTGCHHAAHAAWNLFALLELNVDDVEAPDLFRTACQHWRQVKRCSVMGSDDMLDGPTVDDLAKAAAAEREAAAERVYPGDRK